MENRLGIHLITAEQARQFFGDVTGSIDPHVPIRLEEPGSNQSDAAECRLIIGSSIVTFLGSWEARSVLENLVNQSVQKRRSLSNLFIG